MSLKVEYIKERHFGTPATYWWAVMDGNKELSRWILKTEANKELRRVEKQKGRAANPAAVLSKRLPMSKWRSAKVKRLPGGRFQVRLD